MYRFILWVLILAVPLMSGLVAVQTLPYVVYQRLMTNKYSHDLYRLPRWNEKLLRPTVGLEAPKISEDFSGLWRQFHVRDIVLQLPAGHPLFHPVAIITDVPRQADPLLGLRFVTSTEREMARIHLLKNGSWNAQWDAQGLFRLPLVRKILRRYTPEQVWKDLFTRQFTSWEISWEEMAYNLYLLHLRATILPPNTLAYGLLPGGSRAVIELDSNNKDYRTELVLDFDGGLVLSFLMVSDPRDGSSQELRARFLREVHFRTSDQGLAQILYREFKQMSFARQTSEEGMLYLFSAWSHDPQQQELLKEMIYFLERGEKNHQQLRPLYRFALNRFGKTFTTREVGLEHDDPDVRLQRKIELEEVDNRRKLLQRPKVAAPLPETPRSRMDGMLERAKRETPTNRPRPKDKLIIY
jgi:hypothetical protein